MCGSVFAAEKMAQWVDQAGCANVIGLTTDDAANMKAARTILTAQPKYRHIIGLR